ncbi:DUF2846 domain-containing protein [Undibacterium fentianense]|uniref:DUF2846 domain-containing protein n=1 Tax=Undibacterium fentianense TaxID=2828728 RepID=A0A941IF21_9BURK|nr:DUF2846 domain-containing protein [Undibacterium fentianense]MBR7801738.1 DUF2846 domain-containing protein [Undibacterium fentianense]
MAGLTRLFGMALVMTSFLTGCASIKMASQAEDAKAKSFAADPNQANLYIYRNEFMGAAIKMPVEIDGKEIGKTGSKTYFAVKVAPGKHTLVSKAENDFVLDLSAEAGKNYFIWQEVKMGLLMARTKLQVVDEATGKAGVNESQLIDTSIIETKPSTAPKQNPSGSVSSVSEEPSKSPSATLVPTKEERHSTHESPTKGASTETTSTHLTDGPIKVERVPFEIGVSSVTVERIAKKNSCESKKGAGLLYKKGPLEVYRVNCEDGRELKARCELRQCEIFNP